MYNIRNSRIDRCELGEEPAILLEMAEAAGWPIIEISESTNDYYYDDPSDAPDFSGDYVFDTKKLIEDPANWRDMGCVRYVANIIEGALAGATEIQASRKYSFGDTADWWNVFAPTDFVDRKKVSISVYINS